MRAAALTVERPSSGRNRASARRGAFGTAVLCVSLLALALAATRASADRNFESQISGLTNPWGVTVDPGDNVWVSQPEAGGGEIFEFDPFPSNNKILEENGEGHYGPTYIRSMGINSADGYLYVADSGPETVDIFNPAAPSGNRFVEQWVTGGGYVYLAVDNSGLGSNGTIYVAKAFGGGVVAYNPAHEPVEFTASGGYINGNAITGTPSESFGSPWNVTVDGEGNIYVVDRTHRVVDEFRSTGEFVREFTGAGSPEGSFVGELTGVGVDPTNGDLLIVDNGNGTVFEFDATGEYLGQLTGKGAGEPFGVLHGGIAVDSNGNAYIADGTENVVDVFGPNAILPKITYGTPTNQSQTSGTLNASIDLNGGPEVTSCTFQYGATSAYGSSVPCSPATPYTTSPTAASANVSGLTTEATYHYRIVLVTPNGTKKGGDQTFIPHAVASLTTDPATAVDRNNAILHGSFTGTGEDVHYYFEWGTSQSYGHTEPASPGTLVSTPSGPQSESVSLSGLQVETTYHFRILASDTAGTSYGADRSFKTLAAVENLATDPPTEVMASSATLNSSFTGIGEAVDYSFEWGTSNAYGNTTPVTHLNAPNGAQHPSFDLSRLQPYTTYHYRVLASDAAGVSHGLDKTFKTLGRYEFASQVGTTGSGDGQFHAPSDVAVDAKTGDVYVADTGNHRVVKLDASGAFLAAWGWGVDDGSAASQVCTSGCQAGLPGSGAGQLTAPRYIEVDNSDPSASGDVYVADAANQTVQRFDPSGNVVSSWGSEGRIDRSLDGSIMGIVVSPEGTLFVSTGGPGYFWTEIGQDGALLRQIPTGPALLVNSLSIPNGGGIDISSAGVWYEAVETGPGVTYTSPTATIQTTEYLYPNGPEPGVAFENSGLAVDRGDGAIYVDQGNRIDQFVTGGCPSHPHPCPQSDQFGEGVLNNSKGLAVAPGEGDVYAANSGHNEISVFSPLPTPEATTESASNVDADSATINGHVDPNGAGTVADCHFEYGTDPTYSLGVLPCSPAAPISSGADVSADLSGLTSFTTYHYRVVAIRADGKGFPTYGADRTFTPAPTAVPSVGATSSSAVTSTSAILSAVVNPHLAPTSYRFQYGLSVAYGTQTPPSESIGEDEVDHPVSESIVGLRPGTVYHYRIVAVNITGPTAGPDQTFTTPGPPVINSSSASGVGQDSATLSAGIKPGFSTTTYHFEYGLTSAYGSRTEEGGVPGVDNSAHEVSSAITGLEAGTTYHFTIVATNAVGTTTGPDQVFTTSPAKPPVEPPEPKGCKRGFVKRHGTCVKKHRHHKKHKRRHSGRSH